MVDRQVSRLRARVAAFVALEAALRAGERALLLVSGGPDSMALLDLVPRVSRRLGLGLSVAVLHVDYGARGAESDRDRSLVEAACDRTRLPLEVVEVRGGLRGPGFEERARRLRYAAAGRALDEGRADVVVTAHQRDDQAETVLYRLAKYASPGSLAAMRPREARLARPLLCLDAAETRAYCDAAGIAYGIDHTNLVADRGRTIVRHEVLPALRRLNPSVVDTLCDAADLAAAERDVLAAAVTAAWERVGLTPTAGEAAAIDLAVLEAEPGALRVLVLRRLLREVYGPEALLERRTTAAVTRLADSVAGNARVSLAGGWEACRDYRRLSLRRRAGRHACPPAVARPGATVEFCGRRFTTELLDGAHWQTGERQAFLAAPPEGLRLTLRHPRRGDRFRPLGMAEPILVSRFLAAAKIPAEGRLRTVVAEVGDEIAWVCPGRISESYRVSGGVEHTLHIHEEDT